MSIIVSPVPFMNRFRKSKIRAPLFNLIKFGAFFTGHLSFPWFCPTQVAFHAIVKCGFLMV